MKSTKEQPKAPSTQETSSHQDLTSEVHDRTEHFFSSVPNHTSYFLFHTFPPPLRHQQAVEEMSTDELHDPIPHMRMIFN